MINMSDVLMQIEKWFSERPMWLQDAASRIISKGMLDQSDIDELAQLCKYNAGIPIDLAVLGIKPSTIPKGSLTKVENTSKLRLEAVENVHGINALGPRKSLVFGKSNLSIIYGDNGSGKSGYVRILKHACGAKHPGILLGNVFGPPGQEQGCIFKVLINQDTREITWSPELGLNDELKAIELYDTDSAQVYINEENESTYEPWLLSFFSQLTQVCEDVSKSLQAEMNLMVSKKPSMPTEFVKTEAGVWFGSLRYDVSKDVIEKRCVWSPENEARLIELKTRLAEANPAEKAKTVLKTQGKVRDFQKRLLMASNMLTDENCKTYLTSKSNAIKKRRAADEDARKIFDGSPLDGIGTESWRLLWEQARSYAESLVHPGTLFPNTSDDARCVLCHQPLSEESRLRFRDFEMFVKGNLEQDASTSEKELAERTKGLIAPPLGDELNLILDSIELSNEQFRTQIEGYCNGLESRRQSLIRADEMAEISSLPLDSNIDFLYDYILAFENKVASYNEDAKGEIREALLQETKELEAQHWLMHQVESIRTEVIRLKALNAMEKAKKLTATTALSTKKSEISNELLTSAYVERFGMELQLLGAKHIRVSIVKTGAKKGHVYHQIKFTDSVQDGVSISSVLSEGESRIVSLAAFLADVESRASDTPFVFDDPISSLDQRFEEATVSRLIQLCENRQVIVFTHRLSMVAMLEEAAKSQGVESQIVSIRHEHWGVGEPSDTPIFAKKPENALNSILNDRLPRARKVLESQGQTEYELFAKGMCSDIRILLERFIENDLLADVV